MCYTNHALDQFLEGILALEFEPVVRRVGGRSKSQAIANLNVRNHMKWRHRNRGLKDLPILECRMQALNSLCRGTDYNPLNFEFYCSFLEPDNLVQQVDPADLLPELASEEDYEDRARFFLH